MKNYFFDVKNFPNICSLSTADIISCVEFNQDGDLLATGDKGGRVVIFQRDPAVRILKTFLEFLREIILLFSSQRRPILDVVNIMFTVRFKATNLNLTT